MFLTGLMFLIERPGLSGALLSIFQTVHGRFSFP
jgi:hypothetical protein